jgi:hypothetical protein
VSWIEFTADLSRTAKALERIADNLDLLIDFHIDPATVKAHRKLRSLEANKAPKSEEQLRMVSDEDLWRKEQADLRQRTVSLGLPMEGTETPGPVE